jgi:glycosyltransferase involved in cell wall biosynthesis
LAGKVDAEIVEAIKDAGLEPNLSLLGYISHDDSVQELKNADMLILPLRQEPEYKKVLPGKIFEYLASLKPVLGIGQEDGAAAQLLRESNAGIMLDWPLGEAMADFICKVRNGEFKALGTGIGKYSRRNLTKKMIDLFEQL